MRLRTLFSVVLVPFLQGGDQPDLARRAVLDLVGRDYEAAVRDLDRVLAELRRKPVAAARAGDRYRFLRANALLLAGRRPAAAKAFAELASARPDGPYARLARFGLARAREAEGRFQEAAEIYRAEVARILAPERRLALAEVYLSRAKAALAKTPRDLGTAIAFYDLALGLEPPREAVRRFLRASAKLAFEARRYGDAAKRWERLVVDLRGRVFGPSPDEPAFEERLRLAAAWRRAGRAAPARRLLEDLKREGPPAALAPEILIELAAAQENDREGRARRADLLAAFLASFGDHELAPRAAWELAAAQESLGRLDEALATLDRLLARYGERAKSPYPARAAAERGAVLGRLGRYDEAIRAYRNYLARFPADRRWKEAQQAIVDLELAKAEALRRRGRAHFDEARKLYEAFTTAHPLDPRLPEIRLTLGRMAEEREAYERAKADYELCTRKYPGTRAASEAAYRIGRLLETKLFDYAAAVAAYEKVKGPFARRARTRLRELKRKSLVLSTERSFRTGEKPAVLLRSRNLRAVRVRVYRLDFETFFRGTLGTGRIEELAIEAIKPDQSFRFEVPDYVPYRETERRIELEPGGPGAYLVKVDEDEYAATTLVPVTDLAVLTKAAPGSLFVFTQDLKNERPAPDVRVLVTDGRRILGEGRTDRDGFWRLEGKAVAGARELHVLAVGSGGQGATTLPLTGIPVSAGLSPKGAVWTDRPLYRPGALVHAKAVLRDVEGGRYVLPAGKPYRFELLAAGGRLLATAAAAPSRFGTLGADLQLPAEAAPDDYTLRVVDPETGQIRAAGTFAVADFTPPRVALEVAPDETIVVRGEPIRGRVRARYFFGGPVTNRRVRLRATLAGRLHVFEGRTDGAGEFHFEVPTEEVLRRGPVDLFAELPEERAAARAAVWIESTGFRLSVSLPAKVYLKGENLEARVEAKSHAGKPLAKHLTAKLFRLVAQGGAVHEVPAASLELATRAADGVGYARFALERGGDHRLRVFGEDRFGHRIEASADFFVSGEKDRIKLRLLSRVQHARLGEVLAVRVVNRARKGLCLFTVEADGVRQAWTQMLDLGETRLEIPLSEVHVPNFALGAALLDGRELRLARREFTVRAPLSVELKPLAEHPAPGGRLPVEVRAFDAAGRPVEAEFSLTLVDEALLALRPFAERKLYDLFFGPEVRRVTKVVTRSSGTFRYEARTVPVDLDLRREEARRRLREESDRRGDDFGLGRPAQENAEEKAAAHDAFQSLLGRGAGGGRAQGRFGGRKAGKQYRGPGDLARGPVTAAKAGAPAGPPAAEPRTNEAGGLLPGGRWRTAFGAEALAAGAFVGRAALEGRPAPQAEPALWRGRVRTGADGRAVVEFTLPDESAAWRLRALGVSAGALFGQAETRVEAARALALRPRVPPLLVEGDQCRAEVEAHVRGPRTLEVQLEITGPGRKPETQRALVPAGRSVSQRVQLEAGADSPLELVSSAKAGDLVVRRRLAIPVRPYGLESRAGASGLLAGRIERRFALPAARYEALDLVVAVGPPRLTDILFGSLRERVPAAGRFCLGRPTRVNTAGDGLAALVLLAHETRAGADPGLLAELRRRVERALASLAAAEENGNLRWLPGEKRAPYDPRAGLAAWWLFVRARRAGFGVDRAVLARFQQRLAPLVRGRDVEQATFAFLILAEEGRADFARFNSLARRRGALSLAALGRLVLGALAFGRPGLARELLPELERRLTAALKPAAARRPLPQGVPTAVAWGADALAAAGGDQDLQRRTERFVLAHTGPFGFADRLGAALAAEFLSRRRLGSEGTAQKVAISVEGGRFATEVDLSDGRAKLVQIPRAALPGPTVRLAIAARGRGRAFWRALFTGFTRGVPDEGASPSLSRRYLLPPRLLDGEELPQGFTTVDPSVKRWRNEADRLAAGGALDVEVEFTPAPEQRAALGAFVLEEPLPAGAVVYPRDVHGAFDRLETAPGLLRVYVHRSRKKLLLRYRLHGVLPGSYRVLPTRVLSLDDPGFSLRGRPAHITIEENEPKVARKATPDELYHEGIRLYDRAGRRALAQDAALRRRVMEPLRALFERFGPHLRDRPYVEAARRLLRLALLAGDADLTIRLFEELKDRDPGRVLGFEDTAAVARAYFERGEFERSLRVFQAILEASFLREIGVAGELMDRGEIQAGIAFLRDLFQVYPGLPAVRTALYGLAQSLNGRARRMDPLAALDPKVGSPASIRRTARSLCYEFLVRWPDDHQADEVCYTLASIALEAGRRDEASTLLDRAVSAYRDSRWLDDFLYLRGFAAFEQGDEKRALADLARVEHELFPAGPRGKKAPSGNRKLAIFLTGQIHHAAGRIQEALAAYERVAEDFVEAREAAEYFTRRELSLPEVTVVAPGGEVAVELGERNLESAELIVYRVDLLRLYLSRKSLSDMGKVQLFGIAPAYRTKVDFEDLGRWRTHTRRVVLPLAGPGAFLVIARSKELRASGLLLCTDLSIEAQEYPAEGRLRVNVKRAGRFLAGARVEVVGDRDRRVRSGRTDRRGVFVCDGLRGRATVLVAHDGGYAFYRSRASFGPPPEVRRKLKEQRQRRKAFDALEKNTQQLQDLERARGESLKKLLRNRQRGVELNRTR